MENVQFKEKENLIAKKNEIELVLEAKPFQIKYNNLKQQWRKITDKKTSSRLAFTEDPEWFKVINPILIDTNKGLDSVYSEIADTWLVLRQNEEENSSEEEHWQEKVRANEWDEESNDEDIEH